MKLRNFLFLAAIQVFALLTLIGCGSETVIDRLSRYGMDTNLLNSYEVVCEIQGETFTGKAPCYSVISFRETPTEFINSFAKKDEKGFSSEKNDELKTTINMHDCLSIPVECEPDWDEDYMWTQRDDAIYLIYFPNALKLVVYEAGH